MPRRMSEEKRLSGLLVEQNDPLAISLDTILSGAIAPPLACSDLRAYIEYNEQHAALGAVDVEGSTVALDFLLAYQAYVLVLSSSGSKPHSHVQIR